MYLYLQRLFVFNLKPCLLELLRAAPVNSVHVLGQGNAFSLISVYLKSLETLSHIVTLFTSATNLVAIKRRIKKRIIIVTKTVRINGLMDKRLKIFYLYFYIFEFFLNEILSKVCSIKK